MSVTFSGSTTSGAGGFALDNIKYIMIQQPTAKEAPASLETSVVLAPSEVGDPVVAE